MATPSKQIIAMGGGGFSMEPENPALDLYCLKQTGKPRPRVCFVPTASGDSQDYTAKFYEAFKKHECEPAHLSLFQGTTADLRGLVLSQDLIYVGGGNTRNLMTLWRDWGLDDIMREAWENGVVLAGLSAGMICWFEQGVTDSVPGALGPLDCLGFLPGSACPHYDGEAERRPIYRRLISFQKLKSGVAADDGVGLHYIGEDLHRVVSSRPNVRGWKVTRTDKGTSLEEPLNPDYLLAT